MWKYYNPNPHGQQAGDCAVRAICAATGKPWDEVYLDLCLCGLLHGDWGSNNAVWGNYLKKLGYKRDVVPNTCPDCYTVKNFCDDHRHGIYVLAVPNHVVAVVDGCYVDTWDSGNETPFYYFCKEE